MKATSFERPASWVVFKEWFHCIFKILLDTANTSDITVIMIHSVVWMHDMIIINKQIYTNVHVCVWREGESERRREAEKNEGEGAMVEETEEGMETGDDRG